VHIIFAILLIGTPNLNYSGNIELLVVGKEEARQVASVFIDYKYKLGTPTAFVSVEEIEQRFPGLDLPEKIRNGVRYYKENYGVRYLLLLGDYYKVPARIAYVRIGTSEISNNVPTDFYYAELYSDWDKNRNGLFGEQGDSINLVPNVMVGRIPYHNLYELRDYFSKLMNYKTLTGDATKFLLHSSDILGNGNSYKLTDSLSRIVPSVFNLSKLYEIGSNIDVNKNQFIDSVSAGVGYIFSCAHGDFGNLYINQSPTISFGITDISLVRSSVPSFWGILSCDIGGFDKDALGEHLIFAPSCIGILSQTRDGISNTISFYGKFYEKLFSDASVSIGEADSTMRQAFSSEARTSLITYYSVLTYNLLGDPTLIPIKGKYIDYRISKVTISEDTAIVVRVAPLEPLSRVVNKKFVIYKENEIFETRETTEDSAYFRINPRTPGFLYVSVTAPEIKDVFDSVYVAPYTLPIQLAVKSVRNEYGDTILLSNANFDMIIRVKNASSKYFDSLQVVLKGNFPISLRDSLFTITLKPFEEKRIIVSGMVAKVGKEGAAKIKIRTSFGLFESEGLILIDYYVPEIRIMDLRVLRRVEDYYLLLKIFNQNFYTIRDLKLATQKSNSDLLAWIDSLGPYDDTLVSVSVPLEDAPEGLFLYYMKDSLPISIPGGVTLLPPPTNLTGAPGIGSVGLKWKSPGNGLLFNVYKSVDGNTYRRINQTLINGANFVDYEAEGLAYYYVTSVDTVVKAESSPSTVISASPNPPYLDGWPQPVLGTGYSTPVICELNRDVPGLEIVIATFFDSLVYAFDCMGHLLPGWPVNVHGTVLAAIAAGDIDGDGEEEAIVVTRDGTRSLHVLNKYGLEKPGFPVSTPGAGSSTPCVCDVDGDGLSEVIIKDGNNIKIFKNGGMVCDSLYLGGSGTSPACGDIDNDGALEVIVSYSTGSSGYIGVLDPALRMKPGFPVSINKDNISSPSIGDILPDVPGLEIVVYAKDSLYIISSTGVTLAKGYVGSTNYWPYAISPALGDVDGDGIKDIAIPSSGGFKVFKVNGNSLSLIYGAYCGSGFSSCTIYDVDNDGCGEVFKGSVDGYLYVYNRTGQVIQGFPVDLFSYAYITPQIWDINGDGAKELVTSSWGNNLFVFSTSWISNNLYWPMYKHDRYRTGNADFFNPSVIESNLEEDQKVGFESERGNYWVYDVAGRLIFKGSKADFEQRMKSGQLRMGVYFVKIENSKHLIKRVVVR